MRTGDPNRAAEGAVIQILSFQKRGPGIDRRNHVRAVRRYLKIINPVVNMHAGIPQEGYPENEAFSLNNYTPGAYTKLPGTLFFGYNVQTASVVERNNVGTELIETSTMQGNTLIELNKEIVLAQWDKEQDVEQTIGVPFLSSVPILKYLFSTTTTSREKTRFYMTVSAELLNTAPPKGIEVGTLKKVK